MSRVLRQYANVHINVCCPTSTDSSNDNSTSNSASKSKSDDINNGGSGGRNNDSSGQAKTCVMLENGQGKPLTCGEVWQLNSDIEGALASIELPVLAEWLEVEHCYL